MAQSLRVRTAFDLQSMINLRELREISLLYVLREFPCFGKNFYERKSD